MRWLTEARLSGLRKSLVPILVIGGISVIAAERFLPRELGASPVNAQEVPPRDISAQIKQGNRITIPQGSPLRAQLGIGQVQAHQIARSLIFPATVEANPALVAKVVPSAPGRIVELYVAAGDHVRKGQTVAVIETADPATTAGSRLEQAGEQKGQFIQLKAPATGTVTDLALSRGAFFDAPIQPLMTISRFDTIWVAASVPEKDISFVSTGESANVTLLAYPGETFKGRVFFTSDVLDPDTRRMKVRIALANPDGKLKPGMFANATFQAPARTFAVVPASALVLKNDADAVFVEVSPWTFEARPVETASQQGGDILLARGAAPGERIIVRGGVLLND